MLIHRDGKIISPRNPSVPRHRNPKISENPNAALWLNAHPIATKNFSRIKKILLSGYNESNHGFIDRTQNFVEYRLGASPLDDVINGVSIITREKHSIARFFIREPKKRIWKKLYKTLKDANGNDHTVIDFKVAPTDSLSELRTFASGLLTFDALAATINDAKATAPYAAELSEIENSGAVEPFDPTSQADGRRRILSEIVRRTGQGAFRAGLIRSYRGQCAITGCAVLEILDAAHITPYLGERTNVLENGILLRTDLHTLWDLGFIAVDPQSKTIWISDLITDRDYKKLAGKKIYLASPPPSEKALEYQWEIVHQKRQTS